MANRVDIVPNGSGWAVKGTSTLKKTSTKRQAQSWVRNNLSVGTIVYVHGSDGRIQNEFTTRGQ